MARLYRDRARDEGALRLWLALLADVVRTAPREQLNVLMQDIRHAFRLFSRTPIVTATALLTIALGVGGSTAVFSVVYAVMLRPLPYPAPDRLVELFEDNPRANTADVPRLDAQLSLVGRTCDEHGSARGVRGRRCHPHRPW